MPKIDEEAVAEFLRRNSVTRCPTACVAPTRTAVSDYDAAALRRYSADKEAARRQRSVIISSGRVPEKIRRGPAV